MSIALTLTLAALAHPAAPIPPPVTVELVGLVHEVKAGGRPGSQASLTLDDKSEILLYGRDGAEDQELVRLAGARVKLSGLRGDPALPRGGHVRVLRWQILDVGNGVVPRLGVLGKLSLEGGERMVFVDEDGRAELLPRAWTAKLGKQAGARLWVVGQARDNELVPSRFAIVRPGPKATDEPLPAE